MLAGAAEESTSVLAASRGDAFCGMLNASYNIGLRKIRVHIPEYPVGTAGEIAGMIADFLPVARTVAALKKLKIFSFGPRPQDFLACNAPIKPLYDLGVEVMENSELDAEILSAALALAWQMASPASMPVLPLASGQDDKFPLPFTEVINTRWGSGP